jgi:hypothetical protein
MIIDIAKLVQAGLTPDEYVYLYQRTYKVPDDEKEITVRIDRQHLASNNWVEMTGPDTCKLLPKCKEFIENMYIEPTESNKTISEEIRRVPEWIKDFVKLWPVKNRKGRMLRGTVKDTQKKMEVFIAKYSSEDNHITKDLIMKAAKAYLVGQAKEQYMYTKQCNFFIDKQGEGSPLITWIEQIQLEGDSVLSDYTDMTDDI